MNSAVEDKIIQDTYFQRQLRLAALKAKAEVLGIGFIHNRRTKIEKVVLDELHLDNRTSIETVEKREVRDNFGGETFAFQYRLEGGIKLFMRYSVTFCMPNENFDSLIGMEEALKNYREGKIHEIPISHDKLGEAKLLLMAGDYKREFYPPKNAK